MRHVIFHSLLAVSVGIGCFTSLPAMADPFGSLSQATYEFEAQSGQYNSFGQETGMLPRVIPL